MPSDEEVKFTESCFLCDAPLKDGNLTCNHPGVSVEVAEILMMLEDCDHFCCDLPPKVCQAKRLTEVIDRMMAQARAEGVEIGKRLCRESETK